MGDCRLTTLVTCCKRCRHEEGVHQDGVCKGKTKRNTDCYCSGFSTLTNCRCGHQESEHSTEQQNRPCNDLSCPCDTYTTTDQQYEDRWAKREREKEQQSEDQEASCDSHTKTTTPEAAEAEDNGSNNRDNGHTDQDKLVEPVDDQDQEDKTKKAEEGSKTEEIDACFKVAVERLDKVETEAKEKKSQIVRDTAKSLEGKIPTDEIANEIVHQLRGRVSERLIRHCLDEKYKKKHRVENAKRKLAAILPLNDGREVVEEPATPQQQAEDEKAGTYATHVRTETEEGPTAQYPERPESVKPQRQRQDTNESNKSHLLRNFHNHNNKPKSLL